MSSNTALRHVAGVCIPPGPDGTAPPASPSTDGVSPYTAVQEQLGLKLEAQRGAVEVLVIDSARRPVED
jgi:uncharacterized protein (TIGR03435 family)